MSQSFQDQLFLDFGDSSGEDSTDLLSIISRSLEEDYSLVDFCRDTGLPEVDFNIWDQKWFRFKRNYRADNVFSKTLINRLYWDSRDELGGHSIYWAKSKISSLKTGKMIDLLKINPYSSDAEKFTDDSFSFLKNFLEKYSEWLVLYCEKSKKKVSRFTKRKIIDQLFTSFFNTSDPDISRCFPRAVKDAGDLLSVRFLPNLVSLVDARISAMSWLSRIEFSRKISQYGNLTSFLRNLFPEELEKLEKENSSLLKDFYRNETFRPVYLLLCAEVEDLSGMSLETLETIFAVEKLY